MRSRQPARTLRSSTASRSGAKRRREELEDQEQEEERGTEDEAEDLEDEEDQPEEDSAGQEGQQDHEYSGLSTRRHQDTQEARSHPPTPPTDNRQHPAAAQIGDMQAGHHGTRQMPLRKDRGALLFDGDASLLPRYLEDVEELTAACQRTGERIKYAKYYCDPINEKVFAEVAAGTVSAEGDDEDTIWEAFKKALLEQFTVREEERHTIGTLEGLVLERAKRGFKTRDDVVDYVRDFKLQAVYLIREKMLSEGEAGRLMRKALDSGLETKLTNRLEIRYADHLPSKPYMLSQLSESLLWLAESMAPISGGSRPPKSDKGAEAKVKQESSEMLVFAEVIKSLTSAVERIGQQYGGQQQQQQFGGQFGGGMRGGGSIRGRGGGPMGGGRGGAYQSGGRPQSCNFCDGLGHFI